MMLELLKPHLVEILTACVAAGVVLIRAWAQRKAALWAAETQQRENAHLPGRTRKVRAMQAVEKRLPLGVRPFTRAGLDKLVEDAVPKVQKVR